MAKAPKRNQLSDEALILIAHRFKALSEPVRLKLILALEEGERNVSELVAATKASQTNVSRHLQTLTDAGVLARRKQGVSAYYAIADPVVLDLCDHVCGSLRRQLARQVSVSQLFRS